MDLRELRTFVAVVEEGRFAGAAQRLNLSQPAISHTIRGLEKHCGVILLERTNAGVVTTAAGKLLVTEAREVLARYDLAVARMQQGSGEEALLRIGMPFALPPGLSSALSALAARWPSTAISVRQLSTINQIDALKTSELDLGLVRHRPAYSELDAVLLSDEPLGVIISNCQCERLGPSDEVPLEALMDLGLQWHGFPRESSPVWFDELTATLRGYGLHIEPSATYTEDPAPDVTYACLSLGRSFALAPPSCQRALPSPLTWRRLTGDPLRVRTWAAWSATSRRRDLGNLVSLLEDSANDSPTGHANGVYVELTRDVCAEALAS
ncbi:LysR family transcriptional regulator [Mycobacterium sp. 3519A]|uniref:LysR family transcriptional regulator n=1 Tax=Mycobacterium sp. 3519A TaxID=2057184 RepID=UPI000C79A5A9|nr:LysR family transcriptional regulator [Mycobacterium sp. 3519A]